MAVSETIIAHRDLGELLHGLAGQLCRVVSFDTMALVGYDASSRTTRIHVIEGVEVDPKGDWPMIPLEETPLKSVIENQEPLVVSDERDLAARWPRHAKLLLSFQVLSACFLPLTTCRRCLGAIGFGSKRTGAYDSVDIDFLQMTANQVAVAMENAMAFSEIEALQEKLRQEKVYLEDEVRDEQNFAEIVGTNAGLKRVLKQIGAVACTDSTVLICGETGTGKELIARALHDLSPRRERTLVKLNCAAIPTGLLESELFGHEKGAFTGAICQKMGRFELAHRGTLFLDEVGDVSPELQPKLLRVLQDQEFERLGSTKTIKADVRLVAATNRDLAQMVADGGFRSDLFYRLNVFPVVLPPLRERRDDIPQLVRHFTQWFSRRLSRRIEKIPTEVMDALVQYSWPGNIREMQNVIERAVILSPSSSLEIPPETLRPQTGEIEAVEKVAVTLVDAEREHILSKLRETGWVVGGPKGAAARLGMKRSTLQMKMKKHGITRPA